MVVDERLAGVMRDVWWLILLRGIFAVIFGIVALLWPGLTVLSLVLLFGIYSIVDGVTAIARAVHSRRYESAWVWWALVGIVSVVAGIIAFLWPAITALALLYVIAFYAIVFGVGQTVAAFRLREVRGIGWGLMLVSGILAIIFGIWLLVAPDTSILTLIWLLGGYAIAFGILVIVASFQLRGRAKDAGLLDAGAGSTESHAITGESPHKS
ncbi:HdeD family acid-resistance protein [Skermania sp. ID1734]|uniref:HdeD family acid-resistance protein n=1 Tax=Skermania sp. ID1734 TaxID=2597516 RepID=UPI00117CFD03|nr:HdeD family acid-resistance protein [Skermania sp. ID1734]TSD93949.1 HdeD family acid-resistance protein [Skermania sp. ID1734]